MRDRGWCEISPEVFITAVLAASLLGACGSSVKDVAQSSRANIGDTATVLKADGYFPCGSTREAFDELTKWAVRGDGDEIKRTLVTTHSFALVGGMQVKVLDIGFGGRKVRVLTDQHGQAFLKDEQGEFPADSRIGQECWVVSEALTP